MSKPNVLNEQVYYNVTGAKTALNYIRLFAITCGWTVDYWSTTDGGGSDYYLQIYSPGYGYHNMAYRFYVTNVDAQEDTLTLMGVVPGQRSNQTDKMSSTTSAWGGVFTGYRNTSLPAATFAGLYLFGDLHSINIVWNVSPTAVITHNIGTIKLFQEWWGYVDGIFFVHTPQTWSGSGDNYRWYNMESYPANWYPPWSRRLSSSAAYQVWWEGAKRDQQNYALNHQPNSDHDPDDVTTGSFNKMTYLIQYNSFTDKRVGMAPTIFLREPTLGIWYPAGTVNMIWVHGQDLTIGEEITFGSDTYRCFPAVYSQYDLWQAYRTA